MCWYCFGISNIWVIKLWLLLFKVWRIRCVVVLCFSILLLVVLILFVSCVCCFFLFWCWRKFVIKLIVCLLLSRFYKLFVVRIRNLLWGCKWWCVMIGFVVRYGGVLYMFGGIIGLLYICVKIWEWVILFYLYWILLKDRSGWSCFNRRLFFMIECFSLGCFEYNFCILFGFCVVWLMDRGVVS